VVRGDTVAPTAVVPVVTTPHGGQEVLTQECNH
jgi:hypothetical protein